MNNNPAVSKQGIKLYRCACGCEVMRSGIRRALVDGKITHRCIKHKHGIVVSKFGICLDCDKEYPIHLSKLCHPIRCQECDDAKHNDNMITDKNRKWDCRNYESCLWENRLEKSFNCTVCAHYAKERKQIDLIRTNDNCVDDCYSRGRNTPGGGTN